MPLSTNWRSPPADAVASSDPSEALKVAVCGVGRWGRNLVRVFGSLGNARLVAVADPEYPTGVVLPRETRLERCVADVCGLAEVEAVVLATPSVAHASHALACLEAGKHVFVEKPLALSTREASRVADCARSVERVLMVGHILHYHPAYLQLGRWIQRQLIGEPRHVQARRSGVGAGTALEAWWALAPHDVAMVRWLLGQEASSISVRAVGPSEVQADITCCLGATATLSVALGAASRERSFSVRGTRLRACVSELSRRPLSLRQLEADTAIFSPELSEAEPLMSEAQSFVRAVRGAGRVRSDGAEGVAVVRVLEAGQRSLQRGGHPVVIAAEPRFEERCSLYASRCVEAQ